MKLQLATVLVALMAGFFQRVDADIMNDLQEIQALIPTQEMIKMFEARLKYDIELQECVKFLSTSEYNNGMQKILLSSEYGAIILYLKQNNFPPMPILPNLNLKYLEDIMNSDDLEITPRGLTDYLDDAFAIIPKQKVTTLMKFKMHTSEEFKNFINVITGSEMEKLVANLLNSPELIGTFELFNEHGYDVIHLLSLYGELYSWAKN